MGLDTKGMLECRRFPPIPERVPTCPPWCTWASVRSCLRCFLWAGFHKSPQGPPHWGASRALGPKDGACLLKTPRPVPKRPAQCHPERGPSWLEPQALLGPPSQATEEALMAQERPEATAAGAAWAPLGLGRGSRDAPAVRAAAKQTPEPEVKVSVVSLCPGHPGLRCSWAGRCTGVSAHIPICGCWQEVKDPQSTLTATQTSSVTLPHWAAPGPLCFAHSEALALLLTTGRPVGPCPPTSPPDPLLFCALTPLGDPLFSQPTCLTVQGFTSPSSLQAGLSPPWSLLGLHQVCRVFCRHLQGS